MRTEVPTLDELDDFCSMKPCEFRAKCSPACWNPSDDVMRCVEYEAGTERVIASLPALLAIAKAVAALDTFQPDSGWPMGQACPTCRGFAAYATELPEQPDTGDFEADWKVYRDAYDARRRAATESIQHDEDCPRAAARKLMEVGA